MIKIYYKKINPVAKHKYYVKLSSQKNIWGFTTNPEQAFIFLNESDLPTIPNDAIEKLCLKKRYYVEKIKE